MKDGNGTTYICSAMRAALRYTSTQATPFAKLCM